MLRTPFRCSTAPIRNVRAITHDINPLLHNLIFQYTNPLPFETEPHFLHTIPLLREHLDSYLYYIRYRTYEKLHHKRNFKSFSTLLYFYIVLHY